MRESWHDCPDSRTTYGSGRNLTSGTTVSLLLLLSLCQPGLGLGRLDDQVLLEPDLGVRVVVIARDAPVSGPFIQGDRIGEGAVGIESNRLVAELDRDSFEVAQQSRTEPRSSPGGMDPHALDLAGRSS